MGKLFFKVVFLALISGIVAKNVVWCYFGAIWSQDREGNGKCDIEDLDPSLCTHMVYAFVGLDVNGTVESLDPSLDFAENGGDDNIAKFNALKTKNPELKTILGTGEDKAYIKFSVVANSPELRSRFVQDAAEFVVRHKFDGFDIAWNYPAKEDSPNGAADVKAFTKLVSELRESFDKIKPGLLLCASVLPFKHVAASSYNITEISKHLDYIGLMTYDLTEDTDALTGHNAPLFGGDGDDITLTDANADSAVKYWIEQGALSEKLLLGIPFYGHTFTLVDSANNSVGAPSKGPGISGPYTETPGILGYNEFCEMLKSGQWYVHRDLKANAVYAVRGQDWVTYDDVHTISTKARYARQNNLAGVCIWTIDMDDCQAGCGDTKFPLLHNINEVLLNED